MLRARTGRRVIGLMCAIGALALPGVAAAPKAAAASGWTGWVTSPTDGNRRLLEVQPTAEAGSHAVTLYPADQRQTWVGTGAALTDVSVDLLHGYPELQARLFGPSVQKGAWLDWVRLPLTSTDFSPGVQPWAWQWNAGTRVATPPPRAEKAIQVMGQIKSVKPGIRVMATPWSAPGEFKTGYRTDQPLFGGSLADSRGYAEMLRSQARVLLDRGVPLKALSVGNEPAHTDPTYPTMEIADTQMAGMAIDLQEEFRQRGIEQWAFDHNWEHRARVDNVIGLGGGAFSAGAFHCYGGEPEAMKGLRIPAVVTECTGTDDSWEGTFRWDAEVLGVRALRAGATGVFFWNLALRDGVANNSGGQCPHCRGVVNVGTTAPRIRPGPEFYTLAHLGRAARPGWRVIGAESSPGINAVAFRSSGTVGVFGHNNSGADRVIEFKVLGGQPARFAVKKGELFSVRGPVAAGQWNGRIVRTPEGARYYVDKTGYRHTILDDRVFDCHGGWANTVEISGATAAGIPIAEDAACFAGLSGDIIRHPTDGDSYVLEGPANAVVRNWIPTAPDFVCARAEQNRRVVSVARYHIVELARGPDRAGGNCIVRSPAGDAHFVNNEGRREWVPDSPTWDCEVGRGIRVLDVPTGFVQTIDEVGWHYCLNKANLRNKILRHAAGDSSYIHPDDTRTWIPDSPTWDCRMRQGVPVVDTRWRQYVDAFTDRGWDYCFDPVVFRSKVLRHADGDAYYVHPDDTKTWIPDGFTWGCRTNRGTPVVHTRWREYVNRFTGSQWDYCYDVNTMKNRILSHPDGDSHYVDGAGVRHWIPNPGVYDCLRRRGIPADTVRWREYVDRTPQGDWAVCGDTITTWQRLDRGQTLLSSDGRYRLAMQSDGNLVVYNPYGRAIWATYRSGQYTVVQGDGNLVEYTASGSPVWATGTVNSGANRLVMQSDGNLVLYAGSRAVWATNTVGR